MFTPTNSLEEHLVQAAKDPVARPAFYDALMDANVVVIGESAVDETGPQALEPGANLSIMQYKKPDGSAFIPFFSSLHALEEAMDKPTPYIELPARALFQMSKENTLILNPGNDYGREFKPHEVQALLVTGTTRIPTERIADDNTKVLLKPPAHEPEEMCAAVSTLLADHHKEVWAAYLCLMQNPKSGDGPVLVMGFEANAEENITKAMRAAGVVVSDTAPDSATVDFIEVKRNEEGISEYMRQRIKPFYKRKRSIFGK